jgi:hypothetical protein
MTAYVVSAVVVVLISTLAIFGVIVLRPDKDNTGLIAIICGSIAPTSAAILALMKAQDTHLIVNSRFDKVIEATKAIARKEGVDDERARGAAIATALATEPPKPDVTAG